MKKDAEQMKKYTDFKERFQKVLKCDEKPVRAIRLDELYREVYSYCKGAVLTPEILTLFWPLLEDIFVALEDAGEAYPGFQKQVESFLKAINEAKQYTPEKKLAAADAIITNAVAIKTNDPRTEKRMQGVIYLCERLKVEALPQAAPGGGAGENPIVDKWERLTFYRMNADKILRYRIDGTGKIKSVHCDTLGLIKGEFDVLFVILQELPINKIQGYTKKSIEVHLSGIRKKFKEYFGPEIDPLGRGGTSPKFHIKPEAQVDTLTGQNIENYSDKDDTF